MFGGEGAMRGERGRGLIGWRQDRTQRTDNHETDGGVGQNGRNEGRTNEKKLTGTWDGTDETKGGRTKKKSYLLLFVVEMSILPPRVVDETHTLFDISEESAQCPFRSQPKFHRNKTKFSGWCTTGNRMFP